LAADGFENLEVAQCGGIEEEGFGTAVFLEAAEVFRFRAEIFGCVVNESASRPESGVGVREAEALEIEHAECGGDGACTIGGFKMIAGELCHQSAGAEMM
jgi:hypothetical protein